MKTKIWAAGCFAAIFALNATAEIVISAIYEGGGMRFGMYEEIMTGRVFMERYGVELAKRSKVEAVVVVVDLRFPVGKIPELRGLMDKIGVCAVKYYVTSEDGISAVEFQFKGPAIKTPVANRRIEK